MLDVSAEVDLGILEAVQGAVVDALDTAEVVDALEAAAHPEGGKWKCVNICYYL